MAQHVRFIVDAGVAVEFCDSKRGSNENANASDASTCRRPADISTLGQRQLKPDAQSLNRRPRTTICWKSASDRPVNPQASHPSKCESPIDDRCVGIDLHHRRY